VDLRSQRLRAGLASGHAEEHFIGPDTFVLTWESTGTFQGVVKDDFGVSLGPERPVAVLDERPTSSVPTWQRS
jgi:hypothetical protein